MRNRGHGKAPRGRFAALIVTGLFLLAGCGGSGSSEAASSATASPTGSGDSVTIQTFAFTPQAITVKAGATVTWTNQDQILHTATSGTPSKPTGLFDGPMDGAGKTFSFTFAKPGTYRYFCSRHNVMRGVVVVQ